MYNRPRDTTMSNPVYLHPILMGKYDIVLSGKTIPYTLKRSHKAKLIWLDIKRQTGLTVTVPQYYNILRLSEYLQKNTHWILTNYEKYCPDTLSCTAVPVQPVNTVSFLGKSLKVMQNRNGHGRTAVTLEQNKLVVSLHSSGANLSSEELANWLKAQAIRLIKDKVKMFSRRMGLVYNRVVIRDQRSRWGSCSCLKNLNFNWRLIMAPEPVLDYVIIHELCHLKEMSHSKKFWDLVAQYCPHWHEHRDWLDNHSLDYNTALVFN